MPGFGAISELAISELDVAAAPSGPSGSVAITETADFWNVSATLTWPTITAAGAWTEGPPDIWAASGTLVFPNITAAGAWTEGADQWAATGTVAWPTITASAAWTEGPDAWAVSATVTWPAITGTGAWAEGPDAWLATGSVTLPAITGAAAWVEAADAWVANGGVLGIITGAVAWVEGQDRFYGSASLVSVILPGYNGDWSISINGSIVSGAGYDHQSRILRVFYDNNVSIDVPGQPWQVTNAIYTSADPQGYCLQLVEDFA